MEISPKDLYLQMKDKSFATNSILIDVREPAEYAAEHIPSSNNIPLGGLELHTEELATYKKIYLYCRSGGRSGKACRKLQEMMLDNWVNLAGGILEWKNQDLPTLQN